MTYKDKCQYQSAFRSFVDLSRFQNPYSVTLTMKQSYVTRLDHLAVHSRVDRYRAVQNFRHFMNLLNRRVYGHSFVRHGKRIQVIPILEGGETTRLHYHCVIDCPRPNIDQVTFDDMIRRCWSKTDYGYHEVDVQPDSDNGWVNYISKQRGKPNFDQSIDWENLHQI